MKSFTMLKTLVAVVSMSMLLGSCVVHREHHGPPPPKKHKKHKKPKPPRHPHYHGSIDTEQDGGTYFAFVYQQTRDEGQVDEKRGTS